MDFHDMKRKELQALCKKHGVPANLTNREMADRLASIFKENEDPVSLEELSTNPEEICSENEAMVVKKPLKKVRFSPDNQTFEYEVSVCQQAGRRSRKQTLSKNPAQVLENAPKSDDIKKFEGCPLRVTRSRVQNAVEEDINMVFLPPVGRKRGRGGKKNKNAKEVANIGDSEGLELGQKEDFKNGLDKVTGGLSGRQLRSRKKVTQEDSKKITDGKGGDKVHLLDESSEAKTVPKQSTRNARKDLSVASSSEVEKVEVVSRVTRQSRAQSKDVASMVKKEVKIVEVKGGCEAEKPLRRSKRNSEKDCAKSAPSIKSETQVTKVQEQSERDIALVEPPECLRRYSSRRKSVASQSGKGENKEETLKYETRKRSRTTELNAIVEDSRKAERAKYAVTSQLQAPLRRSRRKTEELPRKSSRNSSRYSLSGTSKEDQIAVAENNQGVEQQTQESTLEEEKTSAREHHPVTQKPQRRSGCNTSVSASVEPSNPIAKGVVKKRQSKSRMAIVEEEAAIIESLPSPGELAAGTDELVAVSEGAGNKNNLDLDVSKQVVKNGDACSNKSRKGLRRNSGAKKQRGFAEASPLFLNMEECKNSAGNTEETLTTSSVKLVGPSSDQDKHFAHKSVAVYEKESNLVEDVIEKLVPGGSIESEVNCMSSQTVNTCVFDDANCSDPKRLKFGSYCSHGVDSSQITFPVESHGNGVSDQEMKEDIKLTDRHSAHESLAVDTEDRTLVESDKERLVQVDAANSETNHHSSSWSLSGTGAVNDSNWVKFRQVEFESNVINMDSSDITSIIGLPLGEKRDLTGATSTFHHSEKELGTELRGGENNNFENDNVTADDSRTPFGEAQIVAELKDTNVTAAESVKEEVFNLNKFVESSGLKSELENSLKKSEEMIATDVSNREGIPHIETSVEAAENQESSAQSHFATAETDARKIFESQQSLYSNIVAPGTPYGPAPGNQFEDKCRAEAADTVGRGKSDQERSEDPNPGNAPCILESVLMYEENSGLVKNDEEIRIHDYFESESPPSLNRTGAVDDSKLVEYRMVDFGSSVSKVVCPEIAYLAGVSSSASQGDHAGKTSSRIELEKVLETQEPSKNIYSINYNMDAEGIRTPVAEDQIKGKLENANVTIADSVEEVIFNNLLNELDESIGLKRGSEIPLKTSEKPSATKFCDEEGIILTESSVKAEKQEHITEIDVVAAITGTPNTTEMKCSSSTATRGTPFGLAPQSQDKLCSAGITVSIAGSETCNQDVEISLAEDEKEKLLQDDTIKGEIKNQPFLSLNRTGSPEDAWVEVASKANKVVSSGMAYLADVYSSANQTNFAGETSNELKLEKVLDLVESSRTENVNYRSDKIEVKVDTSLALKDQSSMYLEDTNITAAERVQETLFWDHLNKVCESGSTKEPEVSLKKAEETATDNSSGIGMVQTESLVETNEMSEAPGQKTIMAKQWSLSSHEKDLISLLRPQVGSQYVQGTIYGVEIDVSNSGYAMPGQLNSEENVKIVENEATINTENELLFRGKRNIDQSSEGKFRTDGVYDPLSGSIDSQSAKDKKLDVSDGSFNYVSGEAQGKHLCEVLDGEGTDPVSPEEKGDVYPQCISNDKLPFSSCLPVINDMQEKSEALCMDNKNTRNEIPANILPQLALELLDNESETTKQCAEGGEANARAFSNATQALPPEELTAPITSESFSTSPLDHALEDGERNASGERVMDHPCIKDFAATMDSNGVSASGETDVQEDNIVEKIATLNLKVELTDYSGGNVDAELYNANMSDTETIFQETDTFGVTSTECPEEISNAPAAVGTENYGDLDDQCDEVGVERDCSFSFGVDGLTSTVGLIMDNISVVGTLESTLNSNDPQSGTKVDDPDIIDSDAAKQLDTAFTIEEVGVEDGEKALVCHQRSLHGGEQEDVSSFADTPCSKLEISIEKEYSQAMDDINDVEGTEISTECKVTRKERDRCQINTGGLNEVTDGSFVEGSKIDLEEIAEAESDDCDGSMKIDTAQDSIDSLDVNQSPCLDERKSCDLKTEEPHALQIPENRAGDSREVESCSKPDIVSSVKPKMVVDRSSVSSICVTSDGTERKHVENPDESNIFTNMEMSLHLRVEDEVKKSDAKAGDSNDVALDKAITECNSSDFKEGDYVARSDVEDTNFLVKKDGPEETMELRKNFSGQDAAMADKSPLLKNSEIGRVVNGEEAAFQTELNLLNESAKKEMSNSVSIKQLISSVMKSKSKCGLTKRTPKRPIFHDMKENEGSTKKAQIGNRTTPKTSSKLRRPLERI